MRSKRLTLFVFSILFVVEAWINRGTSLTIQQWIMLAFAASMAGRAVAYLGILEWLRAPFVILAPHSSGAGADYHPRYKAGALGAVGELICCPVCAGAWSANVLITVHMVHPGYGLALITALSAAAAAWLISWATESLEWNKHLARERAGYANRVNRHVRAVDARNHQRAIAHARQQAREGRDRRVR